MLTFDDCGLLRAGAQLSAAELDDSYKNGVMRTETEEESGRTLLWDSQRLSDLIQFEYVGLDSIQSALLLQKHLWHLVPKGRKGC